VPLLFVISTAAPAQMSDDVATANRTGLVLEVPYVSQEPELCGAAAVVMTFRYWGGPSPPVSDFTTWIDPGVGGIMTDVLANGVRQLGWQAHTFYGTDSELRAQLRKGRPLVVLLDAGGKNLHYVLAVGFDDDTFLVHDPATRAYEAVPFAKFISAWARSGYWTLLILPASHRRGISPPAAAESRNSKRVSTRGGERSLADIAARRIVQRKPDEALQWARAAVDADPEDRYAKLTLATALYLLDRQGAALEVWNETGRPVVDRIEFDGLAHTMPRVAERQLGIEPNDLLTNEVLAAASRRLSALPAAQRTRLSWVPLEDGRAEVRAAVMERQLLPSGWTGFSQLAVHAALDREIRIESGSVFGLGEAWEAEWRWWTNRPRIGLVLRAPTALLGISAIWSVDGAWDRQTYGVSNSPTNFVEDGVHGGIGGSRWLSGAMRAALALGLHRWDPSGDFLSMEAKSELRAGRQAAILLTGQWWLGLDAPSAVVGDVRFAWRTPTAVDALSVSIRGGARVSTAEAPLAVWGGAGLRRYRGALLRAHPLLVDGVIRGPVFGRRLAHGSVETTVPLARAGPIRMGLATFVDAAAVGGRLDGATGSAGSVDAGIGGRLGVDGWPGYFRLDGGIGLLDGATAVSVAWRGGWPDWH
jgi:hypothetical protein